MTREQVIKGLECCKEMGCLHCPYYRKNEEGPCPMYDAALALLKESESIVRCKDCKWWDKKDDSPYGYCHACKHGHRSEHWEIGIYRTYKGDWFCADGERKDDDELQKPD